ncbi:MAG: preprotein translocase subunit SecG [Cytophagales bacterium]|nr:preprotein translocase subunit SecG [Cytophagales bacterium]MDW8384663.1 preprotein translocase subunit SecG [Flammeovirgaceae bacterium]
MLYFVIILTLFVCVLLVLVVLAQNSKGGLATGMGGATQLMGTRRTADTIEKATWILAGALIFLCLLSTIFVSVNTSSENEFSSPNVERAKESALPELTTPSNQQSTSNETKNNDELFDKKPSQ